MNFLTDCSQHETAATALLRKLISEKEVIVAPGVFSPVVAQLAQRLGFNAVYFSGGGFANLLGLPDLGLTTLTEVAEAVRRICSVVKVPVIVDADTGFGEALNVTRTVHEIEMAGGAAIHIEDQVMPKKCGHLSGKQLVGADEMAKKIISAKVEARRNLVLIARTDARAVEGLDSAVDRARIYLKAGADIIFPEALETKEEFLEFAKKVDAPLLANMTEFGKTPYITASEFGKMGYAIVIFPMTAFRTMLKAVKDTFEELKTTGSQKNMLDEMMTRDQIYDLINYYDYEKTDQRAMQRTQDLFQSVIIPSN